MSSHALTNVMKVRDGNLGNAIAQVTNPQASRRLTAALSRHNAQRIAGAYCYWIFVVFCVSDKPSLMPLIHSVVLIK